MRFHSACALLAVGLLFGCGTQGSNNQQFEPIRQLVCKGAYEEAIPLLEDYSGKHSSRAGLFLGKAYIGLGDFENAQRVFEETIVRFPDSLEAHKCKYKLAVLNLLAGENIAARKQFEAVADANDGPLSPEAAAFVRFLK